jgi:hypothetical protein
VPVPKTDIPSRLPILQFGADTVKHQSTLDKIQFQWFPAEGIERNAIENLRYQDFRSGRITAWETFLTTLTYSP